MLCWESAAVQRTFLGGTIAVESLGGIEMWCGREGSPFIDRRNCPASAAGTHKRASPVTLTFIVGVRAAAAVRARSRSRSRGGDDVARCGAVRRRLSP